MSTPLRVQIKNKKDKQVTMNNGVRLCRLALQSTIITALLVLVWVMEIFKVSASFRLTL